MHQWQCSGAKGTGATCLLLSVWIQQPWNGPQSCTKGLRLQYMFWFSPPPQKLGKVVGSGYRSFHILPPSLINMLWNIHCPLPPSRKQYYFESFPPPYLCAMLLVAYRVWCCCFCPMWPEEFLVQICVLLEVTAVFAVRLTGGGLCDNHSENNPGLK